MVSAPRHWTVTMNQGYAPGIQLAAAQWLLALAHMRPVGCALGSQGGAWVHLLPLAEQHRLYTLTTGPAPHTTADTGSLLLTGPHTPDNHLQPDQWLGLLGSAGSTDAHGAGDLHPTWVLGAGTGQTLEAGPPAGSPWLLPWAVDPLFLTPPEKLGPGCLYVAGSQAPAQTYDDLCRWGTEPIHVFDPYNLFATAHLPAPWPLHITVHGPMDTLGRRRLYELCHRVVVAPDAQDTAAPFVQEACAMGLEVPQESHQENILSWHALVEAMLPILEQKTGRYSISEAHCTQRLWHVVTDPTDLPSEPQSSQPLALLIVGTLPHGGDWHLLAQRLAARPYTHVYLRVGQHTAFLPALMMAFIAAGRFVAPSYVHHSSPEVLQRKALQWLLAQAEPCALEVVVIDGARSTWFSQCSDLRTCWAALASNPATSTQALPVLVINGSTDIARTGASQIIGGAAVASSDIGSGVAQASRGQFEPKWLNDGERDRHGSSLFMHPLTQPNAHLQESDQGHTWSAGTLRLALQTGAVDGILLPRGPFGTAIKAARSVFATRAVPLVPVLHGMHGVSFAQAIASFMQAGPTYPFDAFISPSACGKKVFQNLWHELTQWFASMGQRSLPPMIDVPVIAYGVDTGFFAGRDKMAARANLQLPAHALLIVSLSRISRRFKCCFLPLLLAFADMLRAGKKGHLIIAGGLQGPNEVLRLQRAAQDLDIAQHITFLCDISLQDKAQLLCAADIFVALSDCCQETHGIALIEAMAAGLPVVAAAWNGFTELVVQDETGLLVPTAWTQIPSGLFIDNLVDKQSSDLGFDDLHETVVTDVAALSSALQTLAAHAPLRQRMGARAQQLAQTHYDARKQGAAIADLMCEKMAEAKRFGPLPYNNIMPFIDRPDVRFAHYATAQYDAQTQVIASPLSQDATFRATVLTYIGTGHPEDAACVDAIVAAATPGPVALGALLSHRADMLRLMRCLKYDLLRAI